MESETVLLVMGGGTTVGRNLVSRFVDQGEVVVVLDDDQDRVEIAASDWPDEASVSFLVDVTDPEETSDLLDEIVDRFGRPSGLVVVAPNLPSTPFLESGTEAVTALLDRYIFGILSLVLLTAERMDGGGPIVLVVPAPSRNGSGVRALAATGRAALVGFVESAAFELSGAGIRINLVEVAGTRADELGWVPDGYSPNDVGAVAQYLMSEDGVRITGQIVKVTAT